MAVRTRSQAQRQPTDDPLARVLAEPASPVTSRSAPTPLPSSPTTAADTAASNAGTCIKSTTVHVVLVAALLLRAVLVLAAGVADRAAGTTGVSYTDIDYHVIVEAGTELHAGRSPYGRAGFRYPPLLAVLGAADVVVGVSGAGKALLVVADLAAGVVLLRLMGLLGDHARPAHPGKVPPPLSSFNALALVAACHLFNPVVVGVTTRGNSEALTVLCVLLTLAAAKGQRHVGAGIALALAAHLRIFPILFVPAIYFAAAPSAALFSPPQPAQVRFVAAFALTSAVLLAVSYWTYRRDFISNAYLYHVGRVDVRHNFSVFFLPFYLGVDGVAAAGGGRLLQYCGFLPQLALQAALALRFGRQRQHLGLCLCLQTIAFVAFNKVYTSQYFVWYLPLLPLAMNSSHVSWCRGLALAIAWFTAQGLWLAAAYRLEFLGRPMHGAVWLCSCLLFAVHFALIGVLVLGTAPSNPRKAV